MSSRYHFVSFAYSIISSSPWFCLRIQRFLSRQLYHTALNGRKTLLEFQKIIDFHASNFPHQPYFTISEISKCNSNHTQHHLKTSPPLIMDLPGAMALKVSLDRTSVHVSFLTPTIFFLLPVFQSFCQPSRNWNNSNLGVIPILFLKYISSDYYSSLCPM